MRKRGRNGKVIVVGGLWESHSEGGKSDMKAAGVVEGKRQRLNSCRRRVTRMIDRKVKDGYEGSRRGGNKTWLQET